MKMKKKKSLEGGSSEPSEPPLNLPLSFKYNHDTCIHLLYELQYVLLDSTSYNMDRNGHGPK